MPESMQKLIAGLHRFKSDVVGARKEFFQSLSRRHKPPTLFITCSDSRVDPSLICQADPGELFVLRNAGYIVPPYVEAGSVVAQPGAEQATIEFAVEVLQVKDIVLCGHTHCGAMGALAMGTPLHGMPGLQHWLTHARPALDRVERNEPHLDGQSKALACVRANVLVQLENLAQHATVRRAVTAGRLSLYGWVYEIDTGDVQLYDPQSRRFQRLAAPPAVP